MKFEFLGTGARRLCETITWSYGQEASPFGFTLMEIVGRDKKNWLQYRNFSSKFIIEEGRRPIFVGVPTKWLRATWKKTTRRIYTWSFRQATVSLERVHYMGHTSSGERYSVTVDLLRVICVNCTHTYRLGRTSRVYLE